MNGFVRVLVFVGGAAMASCGGGASTGTTDSVTVGEVVAELALPAVPDSLRSPEDRAGYVALRLWDDLDFMTDSRATDSAFIERNFVNFGAMLDIAGAEDVTAAVGRVLDRAHENPKALGLLATMADKYLGEGESPVFDEDAYLAFLRGYKTVAGAEDGMLDEKIALASKNEKGSELPDFGMVTRDGRRSTFRATIGGGECLVIFYDSDCEHCRDAMTEILMSDRFDGTKIVAVDVTGNRTQWEAANQTIPEAWSVGFATEDVEASDKYFFRRMPTVYLVRDGRVEARNPRLD